MSFDIDLDIKMEWVFDFDLDLTKKVQELTVVLMMQFVDDPAHSGFLVDCPCPYLSWLCGMLKFSVEPLFPSPSALELGCPLIGEPFMKKSVWSEWVLV